MLGTCGAQTARAVKAGEGFEQLIQLLKNKRCKQHPGKGCVAEGCGQQTRG